MRDFRRITLFCPEKTPLKAQNDYIFQIFVGRMAPFSSPGYPYDCVGMNKINQSVLKNLSGLSRTG